METVLAVTDLDARKFDRRDLGVFLFEAITVTLDQPGFALGNQIAQLVVDVPGIVTVA